MLIKNIFLLDANGFRKADIRFSESIEEIGNLKKERGEEVIDGSQKIAIPGFYNTHTHIAMAFLRNRAEDLPLHDWLNKVIWPAEAKALKSKEIFYYSSVISIAELILSGIVAINDMYLSMEEIAKACIDIGFRAVLAYGMFDTPFMSIGLDKTEKFYKKYRGNEWIKPAVAVHALYSAPITLIKDAKEFAKQNNLIFHMHVSETRKEVIDVLEKFGKRPFEVLNDLNVLDEHSIFAHSSWVTKREISLVGKAHATVSHNPTSNFKLATGGIMPFDEFKEAGANVTLGTDGNASNNVLDFFEAMKWASLFQKHHYWNASKGKAYDVFVAATLNGARALGINGGIFEKGKEANIVIVDPYPNMYPLTDGYSSLVYCAKPSNVDSVFIKGRKLFDKKQGFSFSKLLEKAIKEVNRFWSYTEA